MALVSHNPEDLPSAAAAAEEDLAAPIIAIISDTGKSIMRSHANRILKNPMAK